MSEHTWRTWCPLKLVPLAKGQFMLIAVAKYGGLKLFVGDRFIGQMEPHPNYLILCILPSCINNKITNMTKNNIRSSGTQHTCWPFRKNCNIWLCFLYVLPMCCCRLVHSAYYFVKATLWTTLWVWGPRRGTCVPLLAGSLLWLSRVPHNRLRFGWWSFNYVILFCPLFLQWFNGTKKYT